MHTVALALRHTYTHIHKCISDRRMAAQADGQAKRNERAPHERRESGEKQ